MELFFPKNKYTFPLKLISLVTLELIIKQELVQQISSTLAGLNSYGKTTILEETISRDHTENILLKNTKAIKIKKGKKKELQFLERKI